MTHVKAADRIVVSGLEIGDIVHIFSPDRRLLDIAHNGEFDVHVRDEKLQVLRIAGNSPITVFAEMTYAPRSTE